MDLLLYGCQQVGVSPVRALMPNTLPAMTAPRPAFDGLSGNRFLVEGNGWGQRRLALLARFDAG
jgi:hypothetical protein